MVVATYPSKKLDTGKSIEQKQGKYAKVEEEVEKSGRDLVKELNFSSLVCSEWAGRRIEEEESALGPTRI